MVEHHIEGRLTVNDSTFPIRSAIEGVGLLQLPMDYVSADLAAGRLITVLDDWAPPPSDGFFLYYPSRLQTRPALKALVDFLRENGREADGGEAVSPRMKRVEAAVA